MDFSDILSFKLTNFYPKTKMMTLKDQNFDRKLTFFTF